MALSQNRFGWLPWAGVYLLAWGAAVALLFQAGGMEAAMPALFVFGIFGVVGSAIAWVFTRKTTPPTIPVKRPAAEMTGIGLWLIIYAVVCLGWLFTVIKQAIPPGTQTFEVTMMAVKLAIHILIPVLILKALGAKVSPLFAPRLNQRGVLPVLLVVGFLSVAIGLVMSPTLKALNAVDVSPVTWMIAAPLSFLWIAVIAGLCEEFLFRVVLQTRLAAVLRSEAGAAVIGALLFGLAHVPGLYLRPDAAGEVIAGGLPGIIGFTVGVLSPIGLLYGLIWARTRSLGLLVLLHTSVDFLPNLAKFIHIWG